MSATDKREIYEILFRHYLLDLVPEGRLEGWFNNYEDYKDFENDTFEFKHYDWGTGSDGYLLHKPSGYIISFYKYPFRSYSANLDLSHEKFADMLKDIFHSLYPGIDLGGKKWWERKGYTKPSLV